MSLLPSTLLSKQTRLLSLTRLLQCVVVSVARKMEASAVEMTVENLALSTTVTARVEKTAAETIPPVSYAKNSPLICDCPVVQPLGEPLMF